MVLTLPGLPELQWTHDPVPAAVDESGALTLNAPAGVDWSNHALGEGGQLGASALGFRAPDEDFVLSARVQVIGERTTFDAAALALWSDEDHWAKLCFEQSPQGDAMVVSVVTDRFSDDVNSAVVTAREVFLRIARVGPAWAFHASADGSRWEFVRVFRLSEGRAPFTAGFLSQSPTGPGCVATFDHIRYERRRLTDLRDGS